MWLDFGAKYKIISQFFPPCSNFSESLMSSDKNKPDKKAKKIIEGAPPENNYRLSLIHALGVKESWQWLNYYVTKLRRTFAQQAKRGVGQIYSCEYRALVELIFGVEALTFQFPRANTELSDSRRRRAQIYTEPNTSAATDHCLATPQQISSTQVVCHRWGESNPTTRTH